MATVALRSNIRGNRGRVAIVLAGVALLTAYGFLAIYSQPLDAGGPEGLARAPGQTSIDNPALRAQPPLYGQAPVVALSYVDGGLATLIKDLPNYGPLPLTITGVETVTPDGPGGLALVTVKEAQPAVVVAGQGPCCELNEQATWATGGGFRPIQVNPGQHGVIAVHLLMSHCEDNGMDGGYVIIDSIEVHYSVLGFPHFQTVGVGPYWFRSPDTCPRSGPARPTF